MIGACLMLNVMCKHCDFNNKICINNLLGFIARSFVLKVLAS